MVKRVYLFTEGSRKDKALLGSKGANLCEMTQMGIPVPFGFIISTDTCLEFLANRNTLPSGLQEEYKLALRQVEEKMGRYFGDASNPL